MNPNFEPAKAFDKIDKDHDGILDIKDFVEYLKVIRITDLDAEMIIREYDADGNGSISFDDFI